MQSDTTFDALRLSAPLLRALADKNYTKPSPVQAETIPHLLEGRDVLGCAQTGTGKTAAFALPILQRLSEEGQRCKPGRPRALVLTPTRELAVQVSESFATYGRYLKLSHAVVYGGVSQIPQVRALRRGVDVLVATPGRLLDLLDQRALELGDVGIFALDEADRMLDMGFAPDVNQIRALLPHKRQSLLFSATMPDAIRSLVDKILNDPVSINITPVATTADKVSQWVCHVKQPNKFDLLLHLIGREDEGSILVFSRTKHGANRLAGQLCKAGVPAGAIHGDKSQNARQKALERFRTGRDRVMVATDVAARGIDVKGISLVINFELPDEPDAYVHRIGRTARAGAEGLAISLCDRSEFRLLKSIQRIIRQDIPVLSDHPHAEPVPQRGEAGSSGRGGRFGGGRGRQGGGGQRRSGGFRSREGQGGGGNPRGSKPGFSKKRRPARTGR